MIRELFLTFFKIGFLVFGGGYSMLPFLEKNLVQRNWVEKEEILKYYAIGQMTPGIIAINVSILIGHKLAGIKGAFFSVLGMILPSMIVIGCIFYSMSFFLESNILQGILYGIQFSIPALIIPALLRLMRQNLYKNKEKIIFFIALLCVPFISIGWIIFGAFCIGSFFIYLDKKGCS